MLWLLAVEAALLIVCWWMARRSPFRIRRLTVVCPLDGKRAHLIVSRGDILRCSRLERAGARGCDRSCTRYLIS